MSVLVNTKNEQEEKVLIAFLESLNYKYLSDIKNQPEAIESAFSNQYNKEIEVADSEVESGSYIPHEDVEHLFKKRRKVI